MDYGVFEEASRDYEREILDSRRGHARVAVKEDIFPFLVLASTDQEYADRKALAAESMQRIAVRTELPVTEIEKIADSLFERIKEGRQARTASMHKEAAMACANCGHTSVDHSEALTCPTCGCNNFTPMSKNAKRTTAGESTPF